MNSRKSSTLPSTQSDNKELTELLKELYDESSEEDYLINLEELIGIPTQGYIITLYIGIWNISIQI